MNNQEATMKNNKHSPIQLHPHRLLPQDSASKDLAIEIYQSIADLPIVSPHGHTDPAWFADNLPFADAAQLLIIPDHYLLRMLYSQGIPLEKLGRAANDNATESSCSRDVWRLFCENYHLFRGTPSRIWIDYAVYHVLMADKCICAEHADYLYDFIQNQLQQTEFLPRALFDRFNIALLATTEGALDDLSHHQKIYDSPWSNARKIITTFRPDGLTNPHNASFHQDLISLSQITGEDTQSFSGYLAALKQRREYFRKYGATATDHGHPTPLTANLNQQSAEKLYQKIINKSASSQEKSLFAGQMLTEMAKMSVDDGMTMQIHAGCYRNHNSALYKKFGPDIGADFPMQNEWINNLKPLLDAVGNEKDLNIILFTLDETNYSREIAPLVGHYPALLSGPSWWFHDSIEGMRRYKKQIIETAGFYNTAGFNDDTRAFISIPARHDMARRIDAGVLAAMVAEHQITLTEAHDLAQELTSRLPKKAYKINS